MKLYGEWRYKILKAMFETVFNFLLLQYHICKLNVSFATKSAQPIIYLYILSTGRSYMEYGDMKLKAIEIVNGTVTISSIFVKFM